MPDIMVRIISTGPVGPQGPAGSQGPAGPQGPGGPAGVGVPPGGTAGQIIRKKSSTTNDTEWVDALGSSDYSSALINATFSTGDGSFTSAENRIAIPPVFLHKGAVIHLQFSPLEYIYGYWDETKSNWVASGGWTTLSATFVAPYNCFFTVQFRKSDNSAIAPEALTELIIENTFGSEITAVAGGLVVSPDNFSGTDGEKLQAAVDALANLGGQIILNRYYYIDRDIVVTNNSNLPEQICFLGIGSATLDFGTFKIRGVNADHAGSHGGIVLEHLTLTSTAAAPDTSTLIDGDTLIRVHIRNCVISNFNYVVRCVSTYIQTVCVESCLIRNVKNAVIVNDVGTQSYDIHIDKCVIESCRSVLVSYKSNGIFVTGCNVEGGAGTPFCIRGFAWRVFICGNYLEQNGRTPAQRDSNATALSLAGTLQAETSVTFSENDVIQFVNANGEIDTVVELPAGEINGCVTIQNNYCYPGGLLVHSNYGQVAQNVIFTGNVTHEKEFTPGDYDCADYVVVGGQSAPVQSVNGKTGVIVLDAEDVGALPDDTPIPAAVTEQTVAGWGFTKNTGTYSKPSGGIPESDLAADVQTSLDKADTALQQHQSLSAYRTAAAQDVIDEGKADKVAEVTVSTAGDVTQALDAGKLYHFTGALSSLTLTLNAAASGQIAQYHFDFTTGSTVPTLTVPNTVTMPDGFAVEANKRYEVDILNGYGAVMSWAIS